LQYGFLKIVSRKYPNISKFQTRIAFAGSIALWNKPEFAMHATKLITPEVLLVMCIGGIAFILIMKAIFRKPK